MLGFRVWDKENECFIKSDYIWFWVDEKGDVFESDEDGGCGEIDSSFYIPMQSTGVKDCEGVEIFEGDILSMEYPTTKKTDPDLYHVKSVNSFFTILGAWNKYGGVLKISKLGNIYENPELLEKVE